MTWKCHNQTTASRGEPHTTTNSHMTPIRQLTYSNLPQRDDCKTKKDSRNKEKAQKLPQTMGTNLTMNQQQQNINVTIQNIVIK